MILSIKFYLNVFTIIITLIGIVLAYINILLGIMNSKKDNFILTYITLNLFYKNPGKYFKTTSFLSLSLWRLNFLNFVLKNIENFTMEENDNLDFEFKRYLLILKPYIGQLVDDNVISICNAWIQKLTLCDEKERILRNKFVFSLCYQLARGVLEEPFTEYPPRGNLPRVSGSIFSEVSSEVECYVVNPENPHSHSHTELLFDSKHEPLTDTDCLSQNNEYKNAKAGSQDCTSDTKSTSKRVRKQTILCYTCPEVLRDYVDFDTTNLYENRANNLIKKLRDIKTQNMLLHSELLALKQESTNQHDNSFETEESIMKLDVATSAILMSNDSSTTFKSLKFKLQEVQDSRNILIEKIASLQDIINNFEDMKKHEIEDIEAKHKLEIISIKEAIRQEIRNAYDKKVDEMKQDFELKIDGLKNKSSCDIQIISSSKNDVIEEKNKIILVKDKEISKLNNQVDDLKTHLHAVLEKFIDKPTCNHNEEVSMRYKAEQLERRLSRMEKNKVKCARSYDAKVAQVQREKHLAECSLQLQMVRQRAQIVNEVTDENQTELSAALDKLENKYKEIVANVQATAIQRRMQDQIALESILQAACGIPSENNSSAGNNSQFPKTMRPENSSYDSGIPPLSRGNKVGNICLGNKSFAEDSAMTGYCLNGDRMGELFERVYVPQRDNPGT